MTTGDDTPREFDHESAGSPDTDGDSSAGGCSRRANPECEVRESDARDGDRNENVRGWSDADFTAPESGVWPPVLLDRKQWMGHVDKQPFAPWADRDAPAPCSKDGHTTADECDCDARYKWGFAENYVNGATVAMAEDDPRLDGRAFIQRKTDPFAYVDGDDVRDPGTGDVHPVFLAVLDCLGLTYADISQSGSGAHAVYRGELPEDVKQAAWQLDDEPWGENGEGDLPSVEIYARKRVCVATGEHVPGTPVEVREWNNKALREVLDANDQFPDRGARYAGEREEFDLDGYDPDMTGADEVTTDIRDVYAALDRPSAQRAADRTIVHRWNDDASMSDGTRAFYPTWGAESNGTANIADDNRRRCRNATQYRREPHWRDTSRARGRRWRPCRSQREWAGD